MGDEAYNLFGLGPYEQLDEGTVVVRVVREFEPIDETEDSIQR